MNEKDRRQLRYVQECYMEQISVAKLCEKLKVSPAGLGSRLIYLYRREYNENNYE